MRRGRHHHLERPDPVAHAADRFAEDRRRAARSRRCGCPAAPRRTGGAAVAAPRLLGVGPELRRPARRSDGRHSCRAGRRAGDARRARTAAAPAHDRHSAASSARARRPPGPDRRRDVVDDLERGIGAPRAARHPQRIAGAVDDDQRVRLLLADRAQRLRASAAISVGRRRGIGVNAHDREIVGRMQAGEAFGRHPAAADAGELHGLAEPLPQRAHQRGAELIAGFFDRDQKDLQRPAGVRRRRSSSVIDRFHRRTRRRRRRRRGRRRRRCGPARRRWCCRPRRRCRPGPRAPRLRPCAARSKADRSGGPAPGFGAFTSTPPPCRAWIRPLPRSSASRASIRSVPSAASIASTRLSETTTACPTSNGPGGPQQREPARDVRPVAVAGLAAAQRAVRHQNFGRDLVGAEHAKALLLEHRARCPTADDRRRCETPG